MEYTDTSSRDLRIDMMRGLVMVMLIVVHVEVFSIFNYLAWERLGVITSAEGFVILSGFLIGRIHRNILKKECGFNLSFRKLSSRSIQIYKANITVVLIIYLLMVIGFEGLDVITTFKNWSNGNVYNLMPNISSDWNKIFIDIVLLRHSPHQIQILGLYVYLLMLSPVVIYCISINYKYVLLVLFVLYVYQITYPSRPTRSQFEYAFPILAWQFLFYLSVVFGYKFKEFYECYLRRKYIYSLIIILINIVFVFFAWNSPNSAFPDVMRISYIGEEKFYEIHNAWFEKKNIGILRIVNNIVFWVFLYIFLTKIWRVANLLAGWILVPLGQSSLYVFIMHIPVIYLFEILFNLSSYPPRYQEGELIINSCIHAGAIVLLWLMVKTKFLFSYVPR